MNRRRWLVAGCGHCLALAALGVRAQAPERTPEAPAPWTMPERFARPDLASDEGGLWAMMDREEARLRRSPFLMRDATLRSYLQDLACRLSGPHCPDVRVYPVRTPLFNASMAPNGMLQVWSGLLLRVENEAQLAAVLGHEMGHYLQRHALERMRDARSRSAFATLIGAFGVVGLAGQAAAYVTMFAFSRDQEREADAIGLTLMRDAGYDPREAAKIWDNLRAELAAAPNAEAAQANPMLATHPASQERSATLRQLAEGATGGNLGAAEYAAAVQAIRPLLLDDELRRGQYGQMLVLMDRLVAAAPERADLFFCRGEARRLRAHDGDLDAALDDFGRAIALGREPPAVHKSLGLIHRARSEDAEAAAAFRRYLELAPDAPDARLIRSYLSEGPT
jgi:predicted Zn-dependent protease